MLKMEDVIDYIRTSIKGEYVSISDLIPKQKDSDKKEEIEKSFDEMGIGLVALKANYGNLAKIVKLFGDKV